MQEVLEFLHKYEKTPWQRGKHDCVLFIQKYTDEVWGKPYADPCDYPFNGYKSALKAFRKICKDHDTDTFEGVLDHYYHRVDLPVEGGLVAKPDTEGLTGYTYGITYCGYGFFVDAGGIVALELNPTEDLYWSVT